MKKKQGRPRKKKEDLKKNYSIRLDDNQLETAKNKDKTLQEGINELILDKKKKLDSEI